MIGAETGEGELWGPFFRGDFYDGGPETLAR